METLHVVNIKCGGCEKGITDALLKAGLSDISVHIATQEVSFMGDRAIAARVLTQLGYPQKDTPEANSILKKAQSYKTCAVGTVQEGALDSSKRSVKFYLLVGVPVIVLCALALFFYVSTQKFYAPTVTPTPTVALANNDTYELSAGYVTKEINGTTHTMLGYNGSIPGPTIHVAQGSTVTIIFTNNTDMPTLLHSHGVRMQNAFDGSQLVQKEMQPGETFSYTLTFPDAGIYWYHPHAQEVYAQGLGLYGAFVVEPRDADYFPPTNSEQVVFLSDIPVENDSITLPKRGTSHSLMGHYGNVFLTNGDTNYTYNAQKGEVVRLYVLNAANTRVFNFKVEGARMKLVGGDSGAHEQAQFVESIILGPSERTVVDVFLPAEGKYRLVHTTPQITYTLGHIVASAESVEVSYESEFNTLQKNTAVTESMQQARAYQNVKPEKNLTLTLTMNGMGGMNHGGHMMGGAESTHDGIEWEDTMPAMNAMSNTDMLTWVLRDTDTGKENMEIDWVFAKDTFVKVRIVNDPTSMHPMQHPIHVHGQRFLIVSRDGVHQTNLVWKDTALVRAGETIDVVIDMSNPGAWMAHCHISEHLESGMMLPFTVVGDES